MIGKHDQSLHMLVCSYDWFPYRLKYNARLFSSRSQAYMACGPSCLNTEAGVKMHQGNTVDRGIKAACFCFRS